MTHGALKQLTNSGVCIPDCVIPGQNGLLFRPGNLAELIESIRAALKHPLFRQGRVEPETLEKTRAYLSPELKGKRFLEIYQWGY